MITPEEVRETCERFLPADGSDTEIAFFGGSFTAIPRELMISFLEAAFPFIKEGRALGIRLSTRPDCIDEEVLTTLKRYGVTSIELGAQSMDDRVLKLNGRGHSSQHVRDASNMIKAFGFYLGLQMMVGMYGADDPKKDAFYTAEEFIKLSPATVRIYPTLVVENTVLAELWKTERYKPLELETAVDISAELIKMFRKADINVIRVGLHSEESLQEQTLAGPFHPAFGELCESRIMRDQILSEAGERKDLLVRCNPRYLSKLIGQKKSNIIFFRNKGIDLKVVQDPSVEEYIIEHP